jgi:hypothetical protein
MMATIQDYFNMAVSLTIGNRTGSDNQIYLPDDFRKYSDLKVKRFNFRTITIPAGVGSKITTLYANDSFCLVFFSHPVVITQVNESSIAEVLHTSLFALGRNITGPVGFEVNASGEGIITFENTLGAPAFTAVDVATDTEVEIMAINIELEA